MAGVRISGQNIEVDLLSVRISHRSMKVCGVTTGRMIGSNSFIKVKATFQQLYYNR
jgi:hypothetical protein